MSFEMEGSLRSGMEKNLEAHNRGNLNFVVITNAGGPEARTGSGATFDIEMNLVPARAAPVPGCEHHWGPVQTSFGQFMRE